MLPSPANTAQGFNNNQEKTARQGKTSKAAVSKLLPVFLASAGHSCRGFSRALHPLSALAGATAELPFSKEGKKTPRLFHGRPQLGGSTAGEGSDTRPPPSSVTPALGWPHPAASGKTALQHSPESNTALQIRDLSNFLSGKPGCCP